MNTADWIAVFLLIAAVVVAVWSGQRRKKKGGCSGCCAGCPHAGASCNTTPESPGEDLSTAPKNAQ